MANDVSSLRIVPIALGGVMVAAAEGKESVTLKVSSGSTTVSPLTVIVITFDFSLAANETLPLGSVPPKSAALAGLAPVPVTAKFNRLLWKGLKGNLPYPELKGRLSSRETLESDPIPKVGQAQRN